MKHFNKLTPAEDERLSVLFEECAEVIQIVGKIMRHGYESYHPSDDSFTNRHLLEMELGHVTEAIRMMLNVGDIDGNNIDQYAATKRLTIKKYLHHQDNGVVQKPAYSLDRE